jgi:hypothetical protein
MLLLPTRTGQSVGTAGLMVTVVGLGIKSEMSIRLQVEISNKLTHKEI